MTFQTQDSRNYITIVQFSLRFLVVVVSVLKSVHSVVELTGFVVGSVDFVVVALVINNLLINK